jgi:hypothetical protein
MKTLTQTEIDLLIKVLNDGVDFAVHYADNDIPERLAINEQIIADTKQALEISRRLKPVEVLAKETSKYEPGVEVLIIKE